MGTGGSMDILVTNVIFIAITFIGMMICSSNDGGEGRTSAFITLIEWVSLMAMVCGIFVFLDNVVQYVI